MKADRQRLIADIIRRTPVSSQDELAKVLRRHGQKVTQATLSRDLEELGAFKGRRNGRAPVYLLPDDPAEASGDAWLKRMLVEFALDVSSSGNIVVVRTPPGGASAVARALDAAALDDVLGTVAGDDTIFIVSRAANGGAKLARALRALVNVPKLKEA